MLDIKQAQDLWHNCNRDPDMELITGEIVEAIARGQPYCEVNFEPKRMDSIVKSHSQLDQLKSKGFSVTTISDSPVSKVRISGWSDRTY